jgi:hypothetical protein
MRDLWTSVREGAIAAIAAGTPGRVDEIILYAVLDHMTVNERIELRVGKKFSWDLEKPHPAKHLFWVHNVIHTAGNHSAVDIPPYWTASGCHAPHTHYNRHDKARKNLAGRVGELGSFGLACASNLRASS